MKDHSPRISYAQIGEDIVLDRIMSKILKWDLNLKRVYLDIGAYHPIEDSVTYNLYQRGWSGIAVDASPATERLFLEYRPNDKFVKCVIGHEDDVYVDFFFVGGVDNPHRINSKELTKSQKTLYPTLQPTKQRQVNIVKELERLGVISIDVLNIDVEGAELEILKSFDFDKYSPAIIVVEIHGNNMLKVLKSEVTQFLIEIGYTWCASTVITSFFVKK